MFKLKKISIDRYLMVGSFVGIIFYRVDDDGSLIFWKILSYDPETGTYTRSIVTNDLFDNMSITYTNHGYTHISIKDFIDRGKWKVRRYDFQTKENQ